MNLYFKGAMSWARMSFLVPLILTLAACTTPRTAPRDATEKGGSSDILRPGDAVYIGFSGVIEPPPRVEDRIREDGYITMPFVGSVKAADLTRVQLQEKVHDLYVPKYYKRLTVTVNPDTRFFYVSGQVKREGSVPYVGGMTVMKAVAAAGGFTDFANRKSVQVTRADGKVEKVDCDRAQRKPEQDIAIFPNDQVFVSRRYF